MYIGDVGQDTYEEVDVIPASQIDGAPNKPVNLGWSMYEAATCYVGSGDGRRPTEPGNGNGSCDPTGMTFPEMIRTHNGDGWHAVIGGTVYRGTCYPGLAGNYYFTDNSFGGLHQATYNPMGSAGSRLMATTQVAPSSGSGSLVSPSSVHADASGEIYATDTSGNIYHVEAQANP
jgi:hypothetical protein